MASHYQRAGLKHGIMGWVAGTLKPIQSHPCHGQGHLPLSQGAPSPIQPGLGHLQGWGSNLCQGQKFPIFGNVHFTGFTQPSFKF